MSPIHTSPRRPTRTWPALLVAGALVLAGCGDDDDDTATTTTAGTAAQEETTTTTTDPAEEEGGQEGEGGAQASEEYCDLARELNEQDAFPTTEQLAEYQDLAPAELAGAIGVVADAFATADGDPSVIFGDPETAAALDEITAFEAEACGLEPPQDPGVTEIDPAATRVDVAATDYSFALDVPTAAGRYSLVMANGGAEPHLMVLAQLEPGVTLDEAMASQGEEGVATSFESDVAPPGGEAVVTADLTPGTWVLICPIPDAEGTTHVEHGMVHEFTVS